jgi:hypothetical protein
VCAKRCRAGGESVVNGERRTERSVERWAVLFENLGLGD